MEELNEDFQPKSLGAAMSAVEAAVLKQTDRNIQILTHLLNKRIHVDTDKSS